MQADMSVKASLREALKNAYAVFLVTDFWAHVDAQLEELQGKNVVHVAKVVDNDITLNVDLAHSGVIGTQYPASDLQQSPERHEALVAPLLCSMPPVLTIDMAIRES